MAVKKTAVRLPGYEGILPELQIKDRIFILTGNRTPIRTMVPVKHSARKPLTYFDGRLNRALRFASNQLSPFEDEQDGLVTMEPITFEDGKLIVPSWNINLQKFLMIHPGFGNVFEEFDKEKDAKDDVHKMFSRLDAQIAAKELDIEELEAIARVVIKGNVSMLSSSELRRDMIIYAGSSPDEFMNLLNDENIKLRNLAIKAVEMNILHINSDNRTVTWGDKKKEKVMITPFGENVYGSLALFFKTDEGMDVLQNITNKI